MHPSLAQLRAVISDFAVFITIFTMVLVDYALGVPSPKLKVPSVFKVSYVTKYYKVIIHFDSKYMCHAM